MSTEFQKPYSDEARKMFDMIFNSKLDAPAVNDCDFCTVTDVSHCVKCLGYEKWLQTKLFWDRQ